jgi:predicted ATPase
MSVEKRIRAYLELAAKDAEAAELLLAGTRRQQVVVVTGGPGMGKNAVLSTWLARREAAWAQVPHHVVRRQVIDWDQPERIAALARSADRGDVSRAAR